MSTGRSEVHSNKTATYSISSQNGQTLKSQEQGKKKNNNPSRRCSQFESKAAEETP